MGCRRPPGRRRERAVPAPHALKDVAAVIDLCVQQATVAGLRETAALLSIAHLDLMARLHGFTEYELAALAAMSGQDVLRRDKQRQTNRS